MGSPSWIYWEKRGESGPDDGADGELAWTNLGGPLRSFEHVWRGTCRASETGVPHLYATQKPVALMLWIFRERAKLKPGDLVLVPYLGSGPEIAAAAKLGLRVIACDVSEEACRIACSGRSSRVGSSDRLTGAHPACMVCAWQKASCPRRTRCAVTGSSTRWTRAPSYGRSKTNRSTARPRAARQGRPRPSGARSTASMGV